MGHKEFGVSDKADTGKEFLVWHESLLAFWCMGWNSGRGWCIVEGSLRHSNQVDSSTDPVLRLPTVCIAQSLVEGARGVR